MRTVITKEYDGLINCQYSGEIGQLVTLEENTGIGMIPREVEYDTLGIRIYWPSVNSDIMDFEESPLWLWVSKSDVVIPLLHSQTEFQILAAEWKRERPSGANISVMVMHPAYHRIIGMGSDAIPLLLRELEQEQEPEHWFFALWAITGADPVPQEHRGNVREMAKAWVNWGKRQGYSW